MNKRLTLSFVAAALLVLSGTAAAQCENMVVVVRNSVYQINGLDAFCQEFNKMKADLASMKSAMSTVREENAMLRGRLNVAATPRRGDALVQLGAPAQPAGNGDN